MWGLMAGFAIGLLQVLALAQLWKMIISELLTAKLMGCLLLFIKMAVIVLLLYLISTVSFSHLLFAAGGMLAGIIAALLLIQRRSRKRNKEAANG